MNPKTFFRNILLGLCAVAIALPAVTMSSAQSASAQTTVKNKPLHSKTRATHKKNAGPKDKKTAADKAVTGRTKNTPSKKTAPADRYRAFKINVPYAAAVVQNISFEWQTGRSMTIDIPLMWSLSDLTDHHGIRTIAIQPETRWWPGKNPGNGHFLGAHLSAAWFNVRWNDYRYQADTLPLLGAGISYGYRLNFTPDWGMELNIGAGYAYMEYDRFYNIDNGAKIDRRSRHYFGITRLGVSVAYRF